MCEIRHVTNYFVRVFNEKNLSEAVWTSEDILHFKVKVKLSLVLNKPPCQADVGQTGGTAPRIYLRTINK
jgi:hypothetical protein